MLQPVDPFNPFPLFLSIFLQAMIYQRLLDTIDVNVMCIFRLDLGAGILGTSRELCGTMKVLTL